MFYYKLNIFLTLIVVSTAFADEVPTFTEAELKDCKHNYHFNAVEDAEWQTVQEYIPISSVENNYLTENNTILNTTVYYNGETNFYMFLSNESRPFKEGDSTYEICKNKLYLYNKY